MMTRSKVGLGWPCTPCYLSFDHQSQDAPMHRPLNAGGELILPRLTFSERNACRLCPGRLTFFLPV